MLKPNKWINATKCFDYYADREFLGTHFIKKLMTIKELRQQTGMSQRAFGEYFSIPVRTIENWEAGVNKCADYLLKLMEYKLKNEGIIQ